MVPLFCAAYAAPNKGTILCWFRPHKKQCWILLQMVKFKDFLRPLSVFQVLIKAISFSRTFQDCPVYSSTLQACANLDIFANIILLLYVWTQNNCSFRTSLIWVYTDCRRWLLKHFNWWQMQMTFVVINALTLKAPKKKCIWKCPLLKSSASNNCLT